MGTNREAPTLNLCTGTVNFTEKFDFKIISGLVSSGAQSHKIIKGPPVYSL